MLEPSDPSTGITVDLAAPFGYRPGEGDAVIVPTIGQRGSLGAEQVRRSWKGLPTSRPWPSGAWLDVPILPDCMIAHRRSDAPMACGPSDSVVFDADRVSAPLPRAASGGRRADGR